MKWLGPHLAWAAYGREGNPRDINRRLIAAIVDAFVESFCTAEAVEAIRAGATRG